MPVVAGAVDDQGGSEPWLWTTGTAPEIPSWAVSRAARGKLLLSPADLPWALKDFHVNVKNLGQMGRTGQVGRVGWVGQ